MKKVTFACQLTTPELQRRKSTIIRKLKNIIINKVELDAGFSYVFPNSDVVIDLIFNFIKTERICCPFFNFAIFIGPGQTFNISITGEDGIKEFITAELDL